MIFHRSEWARVLIDSYGYEPRYHVVTSSSDKIEAAWPAMLINSRLTGRRFVTLPFSDRCLPLVTDSQQADVLLKSVQADAVERGAKRIEVRGWPLALPQPKALTGIHGYVRHVIDLSGGHDAVYGGVVENARRSVKRGLKLGVTTRLAESHQDLDRFCALNVKLRRQHGMLPQPRRFFLAIYRHLIESGMGYIVFAERNGQALAALLCLRHNDVTLDKYAVNDMQLRQFRGSHCTMWRAIEMEIERGARWYDMGRSDAKAQSLHWFKSQWGGIGIDAPYYYYPNVGGMNTEDPKGAKQAFLNSFARFAPESTFQLAGNIVYKHLG